jgi:MraZ protein
MLLGSFDSKLDIQKGRSALPAKFRKALGSKIIITLGHEGVLMVIGQDHWQQVTSEIVNRPFIHKAAREVDRFILGGAYEAELDSQGRFIIPTYLRQYAHLTEDIVFIGMGNRLEIWNKLDWAKHLQYLKSNINLITEKLDQIVKQ